MKVVGVVSIKGGVGKTLVSINLAHKLKEYGKVGLIDCDIDNSNFSTFTKAKGGIEIGDDKKIKPYEWDGIKVFSMSLFVGDKAVSMTEDRYVQIIADAVERGDWDVGFLVLDLPAGASDVFRGVIEIFAENFVGNIVVMQPSMVDSARRALYMHQTLGIPVIGLIENMAYFICPECETKHYIFGSSVGQEVAAEFGVKYLGAIPLIPGFAERINKGEPLLNEDESEAIDNAVKEVLSLKPVGKSILRKIKEAIDSKIVAELMSLVAHLIVSINQELDIGGLAEKYGFTEGRPFLLTITDNSGENILLHIPLRVSNGKLKVIKSPKKLDFEIITSLQTFARMVMGKAKRGDRYIPYDPWDAWLLGDLKIYGRGHSIWAVKVFRDIFGDEEMMKTIREKYGKFLERWL